MFYKKENEDKEDVARISQYEDVDITEDDGGESDVIPEQVINNKSQKT